MVLLGGATALLPIYARDILMAGPVGLGLLRSAPAAGALITSIVLSRHPIERHIGRNDVRGGRDLRRWRPSVRAVDLVAALAGWRWPCSAPSDAMSVVIRFSLVQIETPDAMRGRVSAINYLFVGSSNTLGEFESGAVAAWLGAVPRC